MAYTVTYSPRGERSVRKISQQARETVLSALQELSKNPRPPGAIKLKGMDAWRLRVNDYRVIYEINDGAAQVLVIKVAHRKEAYKK
jgi:mRNA interferase RelE/StbE